MVFICNRSNNLTPVCIQPQVSTWIRGKSVPYLVKTFFFLVFTWFGGKKAFRFWWRSFFWSSPAFAHMKLNLLTWKKSWSRFISPMSKIGKNWVKVANYPPPPQRSTKICTTAYNYHKFDCMTSQLLSLLNLHFYSIWYMKFYSKNEGKLFKFMSTMKCRLSISYKYHKKFRPYGLPACINVVS